ncbi:MAG TPA: AAA family ATPase [Candidatus Limnocylindrales bacterium]|nr:AAA family ATPase [Candidatus Limnocylindrales bacterium]
METIGVEPAPDGLSGNRPAGTVTFLFTDIEGSTRLAQALGSAFARVLDEHRELIRAAVGRWNGVEVDSQGDAVFASFHRASEAIAAAVDAQLALGAHPWPDGGDVRVRMGVHTGEALSSGERFVGVEVHRAARVMASGHGGQVLVSGATAAVVGDGLPAGVSLRDLGEHRLKDLERPERLFQVVRAGLRDAFPPLASLDSRPNNLPVPPSSFVGRASEVAAIRKLLANDAARLVTLTGPGGTGKTRLALRVAADELARHPDGVFFVDLAPAADSEGILSAIASAVALPPSRQRSLLDHVRDELAPKRVLLILDNFEQLTAESPLVASLLAGCPNLRAIVTSREALRIRGEHRYEVPPMTLPSDGRSPSARAVGSFEAIELFVERARAIQPEFGLTDDNAAAVLDICRRLDGLPLAIELAAARLRVFSAEALRERLGSTLGALGAGPRDLPARQRTLRATIDWSYGLLDPPEQHLLALVSAFAGASVEAVETVAAETLAELLDGRDPLDVVTSLVDRSLVRATPGRDGVPRFSLLETIAEYARERLEEMPAIGAAVRNAHARYYAGLAATGWRHVAQPDDELDNLWIAWRYWKDADEPDRLVAILDPLCWLLDRRGAYRSIIDVANEMLQVLAADPDRAAGVDMLTARNIHARANLAVHGYVNADGLLREFANAVESYEGAPNDVRLFPILFNLAALYQYRAEMDRAVPLARRILRIAEADGDPSMRLAAHTILGSVSAFRGELDAGLANLDRAIEIFDREGYHPGRFHTGVHPAISAHTTSALLLWLSGRPDTAVIRADAGISAADDLGQAYVRAFARFHSGLLHVWRREPDVVADRARDVDALARDHGLRLWVALGSCLAGAADALAGHGQEAIERVEAGLEMYRGLTAPPVFWPFLQLFRAAALATAGELAAALALLDTILESSDGPAGAPYLDFYLLKGDLLLGTGGDPRVSAGLYQQALEIAAAANARMPQLRAATRLARLGLMAGTPADRELAELRRLYDTFDEGLDTADLIEARLVLDGQTEPV